MLEISSELKLIETLPVLDAFLSRVNSACKLYPLSRTGVVYVHHALFSSLSLLQTIFRLGVNPNNTFVLNKSYSECTRVVEETKKLGVHYQPCSSQLGVGSFSQSFIRDINLMWEKVLCHLSAVDNLLVMDHGGHALAFIPYEILKKFKVVAIEKTTAGIINIHATALPFPLIDVATCATKKLIESPLIAEAVVNKLSPWIPIRNHQLTCGVIGYGSIGKAITNKLISMGHRVIIYDRYLKLPSNGSHGIYSDNLSATISFSDYIFGCTGRDICESIDIFKICTKEKTLISCSSEDKEFLSLLKYVRQQDRKKERNPFDDVVYINDIGVSIRILRGGFPVNFDHTGESVPAKDIQLTRTLVLAAVLQSGVFFNNVNLLEESESDIMLDPYLQKMVAVEWLKRQPKRFIENNLIEKFNDEHWIIENSGGVYNKAYNIPKKFL